MKQLIPLLVLFGGAAHAATPAVTDVTLAQDPVTRAATITYKLTGAAAVVTVDIQTNADGGVWASIGGARQRHWAGDVNRLVAADADKVRKFLRKNPPSTASRFYAFDIDGQGMAVDVK